ncbi:MAG: ChbG/HpnK family deacetylase [Acidobacteria bacterium]|nr:ChbG/HpnK family deacetylase [Acidobacteriota bacterium]
MKKLIVNADDFGFTRGVNVGIIRACNDGILSSATLMANGDEFAHAVQLATANPQLRIGCHLAAVGGKAVAQSASPLVDENGLLPKTLTQLIVKIARGAIRAADIEREFAAQIERLLAAGIHPTHLDTHKHTAVHPAVMQALARVASAYGIARVRWPFEKNAIAMSRMAPKQRRAYFKQRLLAQVTRVSARHFATVMQEHQLRSPNYFCGIALTGLLDSAALITIIQGLRDGTTELMCHPSLYDEDLENAATRLKKERQRELDALLDAKVKQCLLEENVTLISYAEL